MRISKFIVAAVGLAASIPGWANAEWHHVQSSWDTFWHDVHIHRKRVAYWPDPFVLPDRELVRQPFKVMVDNGWQLETTLVDPMFDARTGELTYGGKMKVHWIMTQTPPHRRHIFVAEAIDPQVTAARVASVQAALAEVAPGVQPNCISTTNITPRGGPGFYMDEVQDAYRQSVPRPRLPNNTAGGFNPAMLFGGGGGGGNTGRR